MSSEPSDLLITLLAGGVLGVALGYPLLVLAGAIGLRRRK